MFVAQLWNDISKCDARIHVPAKVAPCEFSMVTSIYDLTNIFKFTFCIAVQKRFCRGFLPLQMIFDMEECDGQVYHCADRSDEDICPPRKNEKNYTVRKI